MKRSKMVSHLQDALHRLGFDLDYTDASAALGRLEHEGMAPPLDRPLQTSNHTSWMRAQGYHEDGTPLGQTYAPPKRKWESEDG